MANICHDDVERGPLLDVRDGPVQHSSESKLASARRVFDRFKLSPVGILLLARWLPVQDVGSDVLVTFCRADFFLCSNDGLVWDGTNPWWATLSIAFIAIPYVVMWLLMFPMASSAPFLRELDLPPMAAYLLWFTLGLPCCVLIDLWLLCLYPQFQPGTSWLLNAQRLRVVVEACLESPTQMMLQLRIFCAMVAKDLCIPWNLLVSIGTSLLSCGLLVLDICDTAREQQVSFLTALLETLLAGLGRRAPLMLALKQKEVVDFGGEGRIVDEHCRQLARAAPSSGVLKRMVFSRSNSISEAGAAELLRLFEPRCERRSLTSVRWADDSGRCHEIWGEELSNAFSDGDLRSIAAQLPDELAGLHLQFPFNNQFTGRGLRELAAALPSALRTLRIDCARNESLARASVRDFVAALPPAVAFLELVWMTAVLVSDSSSSLTDDDLRSLRERLPPQVTDLKIDFGEGDRFTEEGLHQLIAAIPAPAAIVHLRVPKKAVSESLLTTLDRKMLPVVVDDSVHLLLMDSALTDSALASLKEKLPSAPTRFELLAREGDFADEDLTELAAVVPDTSARLHLGFPKARGFTDAGLSALRGRLPPQVTDLKLDFGRSDGFTEEGLRQLIAAIPAGAAMVHLTFPKTITSTLEPGLPTLDRRMLPIVVDDSIHLLLTDSALTDPALSSLARELPSEVASFELVSCDKEDYADEALRALAAALPRSCAGRLHLNFGKARSFTDAGLVALAKGVPPDVTDLELDFGSNERFTDEGVRRVAAALPAKAVRLDLNLRTGKRLTDAALLFLAERLATQVALSELHLDFGECELFSEEGLRKLTAAIPSTAATVHLRLSTTIVSESGLPTLDRRMLPIVVDGSIHLLLMDSALTDSALSSLAKKMPREVARFELLSDSEEGFTDDALRALAAVLPERLGGRLHLIFSKASKFTDKGLSELARSLPPEVADLRLDLGSSGGITDEGLRQLAAALPAKVVSLDLNFAMAKNLTDRGLTSLADRLSSDIAPSDLLLDFGENERFTDAGMRQLASALPSEATRVRLKFSSKVVGESTLLTVREKAMLPIEVDDSTHVFSRGEVFAAQGMQALCTALSPTALAVHLDLGPSERLTDDGLGTFADALPRKATELSLAFREAQVTHAGLARLTLRLPRAIQDLHLELGVSQSTTHTPRQVPDEWLRHLAAALCPTATRVHLLMDKACILTDGGLRAIAERLPVGALDLRLTFGYNLNDLSDEGMDKLAAALPPHATKLQLRFQATGSRGFDATLTDAGLAALARGLPTNLTELLLCFDSFSRVKQWTDEGLRLLADAIPRTVTRLHLAFSGIKDFTDACLRALAESMPTGVTDLYLFFGRNCRFTDAGLAALAAALPPSVAKLELVFRDFLMGGVNQSRFTDKGLGALAQKVPAAVTDCTICFSGHEGFSSRGLKQLIDGLPAGLERGYLSFSQWSRGVDDACAQRLRDAASARGAALVLANSDDALKPH